jgi:ribose transport system permease protein
MTRFRSAPQAFILVGVILITSCVFWSMSSTFLDSGNVSNILLQASATAIAASGMTLVIAAGWIDLSVGSLINLAVVVALAASGVTSAAAGQSSFWTYVVVLAVAVAGGLLNAVLIQLLKVHPLLVTLGTLTLYRGVALHITEAGNRAVDGPLQWLGRTSWLGIPVPVILALLVVLAADFTLRRTTFGRYILAIGGSQRSALETGLPINRVRLAVFALSGLTAGLAGIVVVGRIGTLQTSLGVGYEFTVITAVIVGGTSLFGGKASVIGSALGALLLALIDNGLNRIDASIYIYDVIRGLVLVTAVLIDSIVTRRLSLAGSHRQQTNLAPTSAGA